MSEPNITLTANPPSTSMSSETLFQILGNTRRRIVIKQLHKSENSTMCARDLADAVADEEERLTGEETSERSCYISLTQNHLQKLDDVGLVKYDTDTKVADAGGSYDIAALAWFIEHVDAATLDPA